MVTIDAARTQWSSAEVLTGVTRLAAEGRAVAADLIALLAVLDERRLFEAEGCGSLFEFCVTRLRLSESQAYHRIQAARAAARFPMILAHVREGSVTLTAVALLRPVLTEENHAQVLADAAGRSMREVEELVRSLAPLPDVRSSIRRLAPRPTLIAAPSLACDDPERIAITAVSAGRTEPGPPGNRIVADAGSQIPSSRDLPVEAESIRTSSCRAVATTAVAARRAEVRPLAPARYSLRVTISQETQTKLRRCQDLLGHTLPDGDPAAILDRALTLLVAQLERQKFAAKRQRPLDAGRGHRPRRASPPRTASATARSGRSSKGMDLSPSAVASGASPAATAAQGHTRRRSRHIPAAVRRAVWARDEGRCSYVGQGGRCIQTRRLEFHHRVPFADGGPATLENLALRCRTHNGTDARQWFGEACLAEANLDRTESRYRAGP